MKNKKLGVVIAVLAATTLLLGYLNMRTIDTTANGEGVITFIHGDKVSKLSLEELTALENHEFKAVEDTSSSGPAARKFKGVLLRDVHGRASIDDGAVAASS